MCTEGVRVSQKGMVSKQSPRCVWARESTAPAQGNQSLSRELRASALCPGLDKGTDRALEPRKDTALLGTFTTPVGPVPNF